MGALSYISSPARGGRGGGGEPEFGILLGGSGTRSSSSLDSASFSSGPLSTSSYMSPPIFSPPPSFTESYSCSLMGTGLLVGLAGPLINGVSAIGS